MVATRLMKSLSLQSLPPTTTTTTTLQEIASNHHKGLSPSLSLSQSLFYHLCSFHIISFMHWFCDCRHFINYSAVGFLSNCILFLSVKISSLCVSLNFINYSAVGFVSISILSVSITLLSFIYHLKCPILCISVNFINYSAVGLSQLAFFV